MKQLDGLRATSCNGSQRSPARHPPASERALAPRLRGRGERGTAARQGHLHAEPWAWHGCQHANIIWQNTAVPACGPPRTSAAHATMFLPGAGAAGAPPQESAAGAAGGSPGGRAERSRRPPPGRAASPRGWQGCPGLPTPPAGRAQRAAPKSHGRRGSPRWHWPLRCWPPAARGWNPRWQARPLARRPPPAPHPAGSAVSTRRGWKGRGWHKAAPAIAEMLPQGQSLAPPAVLAPVVAPRVHPRGSRYKMCTLPQALAVPL